MTQNSKLKTRNNKLSNVVAVDLGAAQVRVVEVELSGGAARVVKRAAVNLPPSIWNHLETSREVLSTAIREALSNAGITGKSVIACLPRHLVTARFARLPHAAPEQLRGMIEFEAQQHILFPLEEVILDYKLLDETRVVLTPGTEDLQPVLLAAARKPLVAEVMAAFDKAGVTLEQLSVSSLALSENISDSLEPTALISVNFGSVDVVVVGSGELLFSRSSTVDVNGVAREVGAQRLSEEITRSFTAYQNEFRQKSLSRVLICGAATTRPEGDWIEHSLTDTLEMGVERLQTGAIFAGDPELRGYATAIGLSLQAGSGGIAGVNLVPNERAEKRAFQQKQSKQALLLVAALGLVGVLGYFYYNWTTTQDRDQKLAVAANSDLTAALKHQAEVKKTYDKSDALENAVKTGLDRIHPSVDILAALDQAMPKSSEIWLTQLGYESGGILAVRGEAKTSSSVTQLIVNLQKSGSFKEVRLGSLGDVEDSATTARNSAEANSNASASNAQASNSASAADTSTAGKVTPLPGMPNMPGGSPVAGAGPPSGMTTPPGTNPPPGVTLPPGMVAPPGAALPPRMVSPQGGAAPAAMIPNSRGQAVVNKLQTSLRQSGETPKMASIATRATLTRFVINCKLKKDGVLIVSGGEELKAGDAGKAAKSTVKSRVLAAKTDATNDTGDENADGQ